MSRILHRQHTGEVSSEKRLPNFTWSLWRLRTELYSREVGFALGRPSLRKIDRGVVQLCGGEVGSVRVVEERVLSPCEVKQLLLRPRNGSFTIKNGIKNDTLAVGLCLESHEWLLWWLR